MGLGSSRVADAVPRLVLDGQVGQTGVDGFCRTCRLPPWYDSSIFQKTEQIIGWPRSRSKFGQPSILEGKPAMQPPSRGLDEPRQASHLGHRNLSRKRLAARTPPSKEYFGPRPGFVSTKLSFFNWSSDALFNFICSRPPLSFVHVKLNFRLHSRIQGPSSMWACRSGIRRQALGQLLAHALLLAQQISSSNLFPNCPA